MPLARNQAAMLEDLQKAQKAGNNEKLCQVLDLFLASSEVTMEFVVNSGGKVVKALRGSQDEAVRKKAVELTAQWKAMVAGQLAAKKVVKKVTVVRNEVEMVQSQREAARSKTSERPVKLFFSSSKDSDDLHIGIPSWRKTLSNFASVPDLVIDDVRFATVEHYFQAAKYVVAGSADHAAALQVGGKLGSEPAAAKAAGSRKGFAAVGMSLNLATWAMLADAVMWTALVCRVRCDKNFRTILAEAHAQHCTLLHFERSGSKSYWGGNISRHSGQQQGRNRLGEMLMALAEMLATGKLALRHQQHEAGAKSGKSNSQMARWKTVGEALRRGEYPHNVDEAM